MSSIPTVYITEHSLDAVLRGDPWVFSEDVARIRDVDPDNHRVVVRDDDGRVIGHGFYSPESRIRVQVYRRTSEPSLAPMGAEFFATRLRKAGNRRRRLGLPGAHTDAYRMVHGVGDGLPGATVDRRGNLVLFHLATRALIYHRGEFVEAMRQVISPEEPVGIIESMAPKSMKRRRGFDASAAWKSDQRPQRVEFRENGVRFGFDIEDFQKTGYDASMRTHRRWLGEKCRGHRVLDGFSYTGGFGLLAADRGASSVTCVDTESAALNKLRQNAALNGVDTVVETVESELGEFLRIAYDRSLRFDVVAIDPPDPAPREQYVPKAKNHYQSLLEKALPIVESGGLIALGASSRHIDSRDLEEVFGACCRRQARCIDIVYRGDQVPDRPVPPAMTGERESTFVCAQVR